MLKEKTQKINIKEDLSKFEKFHDSFIPESDYFDAYDTTMGGWFDHVQNSHYLLRNRIGGLDLELKFNIKDSQGPANKDKCDNFLYQLENYLPEINSVINKDTHNNVHLFGNLPTGKSLCKEIKRYALKEFKNNRIDTEDVKLIDTILSKMGQEWNLAKTKDQILYARLSTKAEDFIRLGHYGSDRMSCFRNSEDYHNKYNLAIAKQSFVLTISEKSKDYVTNLGRMWGFYKKNCLNFCNHYYEPKFHNGNAIKICEKFASIILGKKDMVCAYDLIYIDADVYFNDNGTCLTYFSKSEYDDMPKNQILE